MELYNAAAMTFEDLAFTFPMPELKDQIGALQFEGTSSVIFKGPVEGRLVVNAYGNVMGPLASNMLGIEEAAAGQQQDALGEIANVICGNVLPEIAGSTAVFDIDSPCFSAQTDRLEGEESAAQVSVSFEQGRVDVSLFIWHKGQHR